MHTSKESDHPSQAPFGIVFGACTTKVTFLIGQSRVGSLVSLNRPKLAFKHNKVGYEDVPMHIHPLPGLINKSIIINLERTFVIDLAKKCYVRLIINGTPRSRVLAGQARKTPLSCPSDHSIHAPGIISSFLSIISQNSPTSSSTGLVNHTCQSSRLGP